MACSREYMGNQRLSHKLAQTAGCEVKVKAIVIKETLPSMTFVERNLALFYRSCVKNDRSYRL